MHWNSIRQTSLSRHFHHSSLTVCPAPDASRRARTCLASHATALLPITPPGPATGDSEVEGLLNESETLAALFAQKPKSELGPWMDAWGLGRTSECDEESTSEYDAEHEEA
ncbi:hypothetical protein SCLCIDRAFT_1208337 [Scleroderma citrinum Foug A]|uniref:Uncharacterized protein n=1 Tax=Scleroderma citrinum Foug A TaxID=1036808 RepID=A0A0C3A7W9_9AGAM|nr:hypothetical protein SCLCIDRAFT_1208337 [Scleroderma citrinum Foug A]